MSVPVTLGVLLLALPLAACGGGEGPGGRTPDAGSDPALDALRACVANAPGQVCPRPTVGLPTVGAEAVGVDSAYWADALAGRTAVFYDAAEICTRASLAGLPVGSTGGINQARRALAGAQLSGAAPADALLDPGICHDVYLVHATAGAQHATLGDRLNEPGVARLASEARAVRDRRAMDRFIERPKRSYDSP